MIYNVISVLYIGSATPDTHKTDVAAQRVQSPSLAARASSDAGLPENLGRRAGHNCDRDAKGLEVALSCPLYGVQHGSEQLPESNVHNAVFPAKPSDGSSRRFPRIHCGLLGGPLSTLRRLAECPRLHLRHRRGYLQIAQHPAPDQPVPHPIQRQPPVTVGASSACNLIRMR